MRRKRVLEFEPAPVAPVEVVSEASLPELAGKTICGIVANPAIIAWLREELKRTGNELPYPAIVDSSLPDDGSRFITDPKEWGELSIAYKNRVRAAEMLDAKRRAEQSPDGRALVSRVCSVIRSFNQPTRKVLP